MKESVDKIVLSGGPHSGKTTLQQALLAQIPGLTTTPEAATTVIRRHAEPGKSFWTDIAESPCSFNQLCFEEAQAQEASILPGASVVLMDRSMADVVGYMRTYGCTDTLPHVEQLARAAAYNTVLFCAPVGDHANRPENYDESVRIAQHLRAVYVEFGVELVDIPAAPVEDRVEYVLDAVGDRLQQGLASDSFGRI